MVKQKIHAKIDQDVIERLHQYRIKNLGTKSITHIENILREKGIALTV